MASETMAAGAARQVETIADDTHARRQSFSVAHLRSARPQQAHGRRPVSVTCNSADRGTALETVLRRPERSPKERTQRACTFVRVEVYRFCDSWSFVATGGVCGRPRGVTSR